MEKETDSRTYLVRYHFCKKKPVFCQRCLPSPPSSPHLSPALLATKSFLKIKFPARKCFHNFEKVCSCMFPKAKLFLEHNKVFAHEKITLIVSLITKRAEHCLKSHIYVSCHLQWESEKVGFVQNHLQVPGRWCSSGEMFWQEWNDDERPAFLPTNNCAPPLTCFQIRRRQAQDFIVPFYDCHNTLYVCNRHMGWVPTVGIELLLNSWKDYYLGALGKTPSMYVCTYVCR